MKQNIEAKDFLKIPNIISVFRLLVSFFIIGSIFSGIKLIIIQILYVIGALSDKADGMIARRFKWETKLGVVLEGIADGLLILSGILYLTFQSDFPVFVLVISFVIFGIGLLSNITSFILIKKWFTVRLPILKIACLTAHILIVTYLFNIPYRIYFAWVAMAVGVIILFDYLRRLVEFIYKKNLARKDILNK